MLAILFIDMQYHSYNRNAKSAVQRKPFLSPVMTDSNTNLDGKGIFLKRCSYCQNENKIYTPSESEWYSYLKKSYSHNCDEKAFTENQQRFEKQLRISAENTQKDNGHFFDLHKINQILPCIEIIPEENDCYHIKWFDNGMGHPKRHGNNEDFYNKNSVLYKTNTLNETAFILQENQSGILKYNYRCSYFEGGHYYKCYYVYMVNTLQLTRDVFLRNYDYEYNQMAHLF